MLATYSLTDTVSNLAPLRRKAYVRDALDKAQPLFSWVGSGADALVRLAEAENLDSELAQGAIVAWHRLVVAHAADFYADAGMDGLAWPQALHEALHTISTLRGQVGQSEHDWSLGIAGVSVVAKSIAENTAGENEPPTATGSNISGQNPIEQRVLTMDDVARELRERSVAGALWDAQELAVLLPLAGLPLIAMATGAAWALAIAGRLTGYELMQQGSAQLGWQASVRWHDTQEGLGPTGDVIQN